MPPGPIGVVVQTTSTPSVAIANGLSKPMASTCGVLLQPVSAHFMIEPSPLDQYAFWVSVVTRAGNMSGPSAKTCGTQAVLSQIVIAPLLPRPVGPAVHTSMLPLSATLV